MDPEVGRAQGQGVSGVVREAVLTTLPAFHVAYASVPVYVPLPLPLPVLMPMSGRIRSHIPFSFVAGTPPRVSSSVRGLEAWA